MMPPVFIRKLFWTLCVNLGIIYSLLGQTQPEQLSEVHVYSDRVANQVPAGTFTMPVSALRYEPQVDLNARNLGEAQSDITIRGGGFESVGVRVGGISLSDPQTGHYLGEIPIDPEMLSGPRIVTGSDLALIANNATAGAISYGWRQIEAHGSSNLMAGQGQLVGGEIYQGFVTEPLVGGMSLRADLAWARSSSDGLVPYGDHDFQRLNARVQLLGNRDQTDLFVGYQAKSFGWRNLYTPFNSPESENLQTLLFLLNHRFEYLKGEFIEASLFHRRNKDDYAFNRFAAVGPVHPFQHTTWVSGAAISGRRSVGELLLDFRGEIQADKINSTSLVFGRYRSRNLEKLSFAAEKSWDVGNHGGFLAKMGATVDESNRAASAASPVVEFAREWAERPISRLYFSFAGGSQLPSYTALNSNPSAGLFRGNPGLGREKTQNLEFGAIADVGGWATRAAVFYRRDRDLVDWTYLRGVTARTANAVDVDTTGFEFVAKQSWAKAEVVLGYTVLLKDADYHGAAVDASFYALNYARHRLTAALVYRFSHEWELRIDNAARIQADNPLRMVGGDEALISAVGLTFSPRRLRGVSVSLRSDNLWNSNYQDIPAVPAAPRQISLSVTRRW